MPIYNYRARDAKGALVKGAMEALSADELSARLRKMGYMATGIEPAQGEGKARSFIYSFRRVKLQELVVFNFQLANMLESGIPLLAALRSIESQSGNRKLREIVADIRLNVESGSLFSAALSRYNQVFSKLFVNMVRAGEESGRLNDVLKSYALYIEAQAELREKIKGALFYPALLLAAALLVILFIVTFIIPQFVSLFSRSGIALPLATRILFVIGIGLKKHWYIFLAAAASVLFFLNRYRISPAGRLRLDRLLLKAPVLGELAREICISRFCRTLATLLSSGVAVLQSLDIVREVIGNQIIAAAVLRVRQAVEHGEKFSEPLKVSGEFPPEAIQMISAGEETGNIEGMLNKTADFYDMSAGYALKRLTALIEPLLLGIMGIVVGFIMASMLLPIFDMVKILRH